jgi:vacuolar protein sorting-associated protein 13A/C
MATFDFILVEDIVNNVSKEQDELKTNEKNEEKNNQEKNEEKNNQEKNEEKNNQETNNQETNNQETNNQKTNEQNKKTQEIDELHNLINDVIKKTNEQKVIMDKKYKEYLDAEIKYTELRNYYWVIKDKYDALINNDKESAFNIFFKKWYMIGI